MLAILACKQPLKHRLSRSTNIFLLFHFLSVLKLLLLETLTNSHTNWPLLTWITLCAANAFSIRFRWFCFIYFVRNQLWAIYIFLGMCPRPCVLLKAYFISSRLEKMLCLIEIMTFNFPSDAHSKQHIIENTDCLINNKPHASEINWGILPHFICM